MHNIIEIRLFNFNFYIIFQLMDEKVSFTNQIKPPNNEEIAMMNKNVIFYYLFI